MKDLFTLLQELKPKLTEQENKELGEAINDHVKLMTMKYENKAYNRGWDAAIDTALIQLEKLTNAARPSKMNGARKG